MINKQIKLILEQHDHKLFELEKELWYLLDLAKKQIMQDIIHSIGKSEHKKS